jgi:hypothetical protein
MPSISWKIKVVCATIGLAMSMAQSAHAASSVILRTPSMVPNPKGHLECTASATSTTPIGIVAVIMSSSRTNVTDYGTGFRASPAATGDGLYHADETAGSFSNRARYCKVTVMGANLADVQVSLKACDANGECTGADGPNRQSGGRAPFASSPETVR